ncbi:hypothetical protein PoB_004764600 [Plakobranchus ocellatus]|uniref:Major facilitator superfamily associated domain-containing protein n=1 Tax=Plakobranchus ocellatus TaxID=259542 RepID=A0AAV4BL50_9GAST|nr:hypothetical protein PoB_004764600 [Plakobranchus ocellatus]
MPARDTWMLVWQFVLTLEAMGLDAVIALELLLMVTNPQSLGVPIRYAPLSGTLGACISFLVLPIVGFCNDRWAKSKASKARILVITAFIQFSGACFVLAANALKLCEHLDGEEDRQGNIYSQSWNLTKLSGLESPHRDKSFIGLSPNFSENVDSGHVATNESSNITSAWMTNFPQPHLYQTKPIQSSTDLRQSVIPAPSISPTVPDTEEEEPVRVYAYLAMIGFCLVDTGYDFAGCFLKTFLFHCTPPEYHQSVIVKLIMISSLGKLSSLLLVLYISLALAGGVLICLLGSFDVGRALAGGTNDEFARAVLLSAVSATLLLLGTTVTLITGLCWQPPLTSVVTGGKLSEDSEDMRLVDKSSMLVKCPHDERENASPSSSKSCDESLSCRQVVEPGSLRNCLSM